MSAAESLVSLRTLQDGRYIFDGLSQNVMALPSAPDRLEESLTRGLWLVACLAVWSFPDRAAALAAATLADACQLRATVAVRPFDSYSEFDAWCPELGERRATPIWVLLREGALLTERAGNVTVAELQSLVESEVGGLP